MISMCIGHLYTCKRKSVFASLLSVEGSINREKYNCRIGCVLSIGNARLYIQAFDLLMNITVQLLQCNLSTTNCVRECNI